MGTCEQALFGAQRLHGFDGGGAAGRQQTCDKADGYEYRESSAHDEWVVGAGLKQQCRKGARACECEADSEIEGEDDAVLAAAQERANTELEDGGLEAAAEGKIPM